MMHLIFMAWRRLLAGNVLGFSPLRPPSRAPRGRHRLGFHLRHSARTTRSEGRGLLVFQRKMGKQGWEAW